MNQFARIGIERISVNRNQVVEALKRNRQAHVVLYEGALENYRQSLVHALEENLTNLRNPITIVTARTILPVQLPVLPQSRIDLYDRYIGLFEMSADPIIKMFAPDFACLVQDNWNWKPALLNALAPYMTITKVATAGSSR